MVKPEFQNLSFKNIKPEKKEEFSIKCQNRIKVIQGKEKRKSIKDQFTGFVLLKKNLGNIEKETKIGNSLDQIKPIFANILSEIDNDKYEFINSNELLKLKTEIDNNANIINELNNDILLKDNKIKEQEEVIQKREEEYFDNQRESLRLKS